MIPLWKFRRETARIRQLMLAWLGKFYEPRLKRNHDHWREAQPIPQNRDISLTGKVAIFLIYQPNGIAPSVFATLQWLVANGYAPLVISNAPVSEIDRGKINALVWRLFERPNFGYDFGGYRDGVLLLKSWGLAPERLLILNDSVWMPTRASSTLLTRLEAVEADVVGGISHSDTTQKNGAVRWGHLESYLYLINLKAFKSPAFVEFWTTYPASNNRLNAVYLGERRFAHLMKNGGLSVEGLFSKNIFLAKLGEQDDNFLRLTLKYASYIESDLAIESQKLLENFSISDNWRDFALGHIRRTADRRRFNAVFAYPADVLFGMDFIKKSVGSTGDGGASLHSRMRRQLLQAVKAGDLQPFLPQVQTEIEAQEGKIG